MALLLVPISLFLAGHFTDKHEAEGQLRVRPLLCCVTSLIPVPLICVMYTVNTFELAMASLITMTVVGETYISVSIATVINVTTPRVRALRKNYIESGLTLGVGCLGGVLSTLLLGAINTSHENLRIGLLCVVATCYFLGGVGFYLISLVYPRDYETAVNEEAFYTQAPIGKSD